MDKLGDLAPVLDVENTEVTGDVDGRAAARGAAALFPTGLVAMEHHAVRAAHQPALSRVEGPAVRSAGGLGKVLSDLPTASQRIHLYSKNARPFARGETGRRSPPVPGAGRRQPAGL
jgi:hypothetical protein